MTYVGYVSTGCTGDVKEIDKAIKFIIKSHHHKDKDREKEDVGPKMKRVKKSINFEIGEIGVKIVNSENGDVSIFLNRLLAFSIGSII